MPIQTVATLAQVEFTRRDIEQIESLLARLFDANPIEQVFSEALSNEALAIRHYSLGQATLQYCQPLIEAGMPHSELLSRRGNCVHNLTWFVKDIQQARQACIDNGVPIALEFPLS